MRQKSEFIIEIDKLKSIVRRTVLIDGTRQENDAEFALTSVQDAAGTFLGSPHNPPSMRGARDALKMSVWT